MKGYPQILDKKKIQRFLIICGRGSPCITWMTNVPIGKRGRMRSPTVMKALLFLQKIIQLKKL